MRAETRKLPSHTIQISPDTGQFLQLLIQILGAKKVIEIGTYTGYSALVMALALPKDGKLITCDIDQEWTDVGKPYWQKAGVENNIDLQLRPAFETIEQLLKDGQGESFDFAFIDADKTSYPEYYEKTLQLIRKGGVIAIDNVLWAGRIADDSIDDNRTQAIRALNEKIFNDDRVSMSLVSIGDGVTLARKL